MSKQQSNVATSSTHVEYITAAEVAKELIWLCQLLSELCEGMRAPTTLHIDNCAVDLLVQNPVSHTVTAMVGPISCTLR